MNLRLILTITNTVGLTLLLGAADLAVSCAETDNQPPLELDNPFFAFDNGTGRGVLPLEEQAKMLADLGYAGIGYTGTQQIPELLAALEKHDLKMFSTYIGATIGPDGPGYDPGLKQAVQDLKGTDAILWLYIRGSAPNAEEQAVQVTREIADLAAESKLRVALYPHYGFYVDRVEVAMKIVKLADRKNVGSSFNLCHFLRVGDAANLEQRLRDVLPELMLVSINGADHEGNWERLIQTLDRGEYDVYALLKRLRQLGYTGPIGLQCYNVPGDRQENLKRSVAAWRGFVQRMSSEAAAK